jgi:hypothetical protein
MTNDPELVGRWCHVHEMAIRMVHEHLEQSGAKTRITQ